MQRPFLIILILISKMSGMIFPSLPPSFRHTFRGKVQAAAGVRKIFSQMKQRGNALNNMESQICPIPGNNILF